MAERIRFRRGALDELAAELAPPELERRGRRVEAGARRRAAAVSSRLSSAIVSVPARADSEGPYVDVGYDRAAPGFVLWWHEVGTSRYGATPHLRPALDDARD